MNRLISKSAIALFTATLLSCTSSFVQPDIYTTDNNVVVRNVSDQPGAIISVKINFNISGFQTKANLNGVPPNLITDIDKYYIYLVKNNYTGSYPANGDPISDAVLPPVVLTNNGQIGRMVVFNEVPDSTGGAYYIAVKAQNTAGTDLIRENDGRTTSGQLWTGVTANSPHNGRVSVSAGAGISVDSSYTVSSTSVLTVTPNFDGLGVVIEANISPNGGNSNLTFSGLPNFYISTIAGTGTAGNAPVTDSVATSTALFNPNGVAVDAAGNIYIANTNNSTIRKVTPLGIMSTIAGTGTSGNAPVADSIATNTTLNSPQGVAVDIAGNIYIANTSNHSIRKVTPLGIMSTIAGTGTSGNAPVADSIATSTTLSGPHGVAVDIAGNVYIANTSNHTIRKVTPSGSMFTIAGTGTSGNAPVADSVATSTALNAPHGVAVDIAGNVYIANTSNHSIRKVTPAGIMSTIAGTGTAGDAPVADSVATSTALSGPQGVAVDIAGNIYIANSSNHSIRKVTTAGIMSTIAGTGSAVNAPVAESVATSTTLNTPRGIAVDAAGNVYIANTINQTIRKVF